MAYKTTWEKLTDKVTKIRMEDFTPEEQTKIMKIEYIYKCTICGEKGSYHKQSKTLPLFCFTCKKITTHSYHLREVTE